MVEIKTDNDVA